MSAHSLIRAFWNCGDNQIIEFAMLRARLNRKEKTVLSYILDECMTQEESAEAMDISTRQIQNLWANASDKLLSIPWVMAYAKELSNNTKARG